MADQRPKETAALWRRGNGIARVDLVPRDTQFLPHPSNGGTRGYDIPRDQQTEIVRELLK